MVWFDEIKPFFMRSRVSGLFPFSFFEGKLIQTKFEYAYVILVTVIRIIALIWLVIDEWDTDQIRQKKMLRLSNELMMSMYLSIKSYKALTGFTEMKKAMELIRKYDNAVRFGMPVKKLTIFNWSMIILNTTWIIYIAVIVSKIRQSSDILRILINVESLAAWWISNIQSMAVIFSLSRRFRNLRHLFTSGRPMILDETSAYYKPLHREDVSRLHGYLVGAAEQINAMYRVILPLGVIQLSLQCVRSLYYILIGKIAGSTEILLINLIGIIVLLAACNETATQANRISYTSLSPNSSVYHHHRRPKGYKYYSRGQYFMLHSFHFSAMYGLFRVDLPFFYTLFEFMTTALVILCND